VPLEVGEYLSMDVLGPLKRFGNIKFICLGIDRLSKYDWGKGYKKALTTENAILFISDIMVEKRIKPKQLLTDNGTIFCGGSLKEFAFENGFKLSRSGAYYPQGDGISERMVQTVVKKMRMLLFNNLTSEVNT
jgi:transposase InsO family protein